MNSMRCGLVMIVFATTCASATDIEGVQMAAMDQPRVTVMLRRSAGGPPLAGKSNADLSSLIGGNKGEGESIASFPAYLDTGASGICISAQTAGSMGITHIDTGDGPQKSAVVFHDIGVGGADRFHVSEPLFLAIGPYHALGGSVAEMVFAPAGGPWQMQVGPLQGGGLLASLVGAIDVVGMPAMAGKVVVMDARGVNRFEDVIRVSILQPGDRHIPRTNRNVALTYADFTAFTRIEPESARRPVTSANPFIGPDPITGRRTSPPITLRQAGRTTEGSWLLDTGAAASMISSAQAERLGIRYKKGSLRTASPQLEGIDAKRQFTMTIGGIGGSRKAAGFFVDELRLPTAERDDLVYKPAPVLVIDISVEDPQTGKRLTLDGVLGMNLLVASAELTEGLLPDIGRMSEGAFETVVIDHAHGKLGLQLRRDLGR